MIESVIDGLSLRLFWRHVLRSSKDHSRGRQTRAVLSTGLGGDAKVHNFDDLCPGLLDDKDIGWLSFTALDSVEYAHP